MKLVCASSNGEPRRLRAPETLKGSSVTCEVPHTTRASWTVKRPVDLHDRRGAMFCGWEGSSGRITRTFQVSLELTAG